MCTGDALLTAACVARDCSMIPDNGTLYLLTAELGENGKVAVKYTQQVGRFNRTKTFRSNANIYNKDPYYKRLVTVSMAYSWNNPLLTLTISGSYSGWVSYGGPEEPLLRTLQEGSSGHGRGYIWSYIQEWQIFNGQSLCHWDSFRKVCYVHYFITSNNPLSSFSANFVSSKIILNCTSQI